MPDTPRPPPQCQPLHRSWAFGLLQDPASCALINIRSRSHEGSWQQHVTIRWLLRTVFLKSTAVPSEPHNDPRLSGSLDSGHRDWIFPAAASGRGCVFV